MDWRTACAAVIPCLNEQAAIGTLVEEVRRHVATVFVVDDGSSDRTNRCAADAGAVVIQHAGTRGKGAALQSGWSQAHRQGYSWTITMDGDGQHSPADIPSFFQRCDQTAAPLIVGNRMGQVSEMPLLRRWVNRAMSWRLSRLAGRDLPDSQCGFRLMNLAEWERLPIRTMHFEIESEVLLLFCQAHLKIEFVPIQVIYKQEQSKIHPWRDGVRWLRWQRQVRRNVSPVQLRARYFGSEK